MFHYNFILNYFTVTIKELVKSNNNFRNAASYNDYNTLFFHFSNIFSQKNKKKGKKREYIFNWNNINIKKFNVIKTVVFS
ncbi:hypothetical protein BH11BAC3_BH11BAC3_46220 [soil metagenome]